MRNSSFNRILQNAPNCVKHQDLSIFQEPAYVPMLSGMTQLNCCSFRENPEELSSIPTGTEEAERPAAVFTEPACKQQNQGSLKNGTSLTRRSPEHLGSAVSQANAMLQDLSRLKDEMKTLIQVSRKYKFGELNAEKYCVVVLPRDLLKG